MKKFITIAALLAAGTAAANAADVIWTLSGDDEVYTSNNGFASSAAAGDEFSLAVVFTLNELSDVSTAIVDIAQWNSGHSCVYATSSGIRLTKEGGGGTNAYSYDNVSAGEEISVVFTWAYGSNGNPTITAYANGESTWSHTSTSTAQGLLLTVSENDSWTVSEVTAYTGILTADEISYLNTNKTSVVSSVPEPSAFGLLAGVGALALVASRRRRTK